MLKEKLWAYIVHHNPELMFSLQEEYSVSRYLDEKVKAVMPTAERLLSEDRPLYVIEELCVNEMTEELRPSKFLYIREVVEEEFPEDYERLRESGVLTYEIVNMMKACAEIFETFGFSEKNEEQRHLRHAIIAQVHDYLQ
jgi:hypothetical protein